MEELKLLICDYVDIAPEDITEETNLRSDLSLNSLDVINIAVGIEDRFGVVVTDKDMFSIFTFGELYSYIESKK